MLYFIDTNFLEKWYSHLLIAVLFVPTISIHISYLLENFRDKYLVRKNEIVNEKKNLAYSPNEIFKIQIYKYQTFPNGNHFLPFHSYKFCKVILKNGESFILTSLLKFDIDNFLKNEIKGVVFETHYKYFPIA